MMKYEEYKAMQEGVITGFREGCEALVAPGDLRDDAIRNVYNNLRSLLTEREREIEELTDKQRIEIVNRNKGFIKDYWHYLRVAKGIGLMKG